jgi:hypothetical protein
MSSSIEIVRPTYSYTGDMHVFIAQTLLYAHI